MVHWFSKSSEQTLELLESEATQGLSVSEAESRFNRIGPNQLSGKKEKNILQRFAAQLNDALIYVLAAAVCITLFMGEYIDAIIIALVIFVNATLGVVQEVRASNAIAALQKLSAPKAIVRRDGKSAEIPSDQLVPGDIVTLDAGRFVPADLRLLETAGLQIDESSLTGESVPAQKDASASFNYHDVPLGDRANMAFMSTLVTSGRATAVVVETGMNTEIGRIAGIIDSEDEVRTPLEEKLGALGKTLGFIAVGVCALLFVISVFQGREPAETFLLAVSLAVASIPEGLAAIVAVVLSIGVTGMSKRNAIVKRLPVVETLGAVNIVCSDKTGTLTQNKMRVTRYFTLDSGVSETGDETEEAKFLARAMILSSDATLEGGESTGDPTEVALLQFGDTLKMNREKLMSEHKRQAEKAFDSDRKLMSTLVQGADETHVYTKGALGAMFTVCTKVLRDGKPEPMTEAHKKAFREAADQMSDQALRTLAAAYKPASDQLSETDMEQDLILIGMVGMIDPPREEAKPAIEKAKLAGVTTCMITGDHQKTAFAIAQQLGIADDLKQTVTGKDIDSYPEGEFSKVIDRFRVFARVTPEHKVRIVRALRQRGNIVSMTGDGVNDAPSLNAADVGVAMGITGTDVAKGASDIILTDDNFATIILAIEKGRNTYKNIKRSVLFLMASNLGEVLAMLVCILLGMPAPLLATQLLWINLLTDTLPAVALGMDPGDSDVMKEKPRLRNENFFSQGGTQRVILGGLLIGVFTIVAFCLSFIHNGYSPFDKKIPEEIVSEARTMAFMTIISCQLFYAFSFRHETASVLGKRFVANKYLLWAVALGFALQFLVFGVPALQQAFKLSMPDAQQWLYIIGLGLLPLALNEIAKIIMRRKIHRTDNQTEL